MAEGERAYCTLPSLFLSPAFTCAPRLSLQLRLHIVPYTHLPPVFIDFRLSNFFRAPFSLLFPSPSPPPLPRVTLLSSLRPYLTIEIRACRTHTYTRTAAESSSRPLVSTVSLNRVVFALHVAFTLHAFFASSCSGTSRPFYPSPPPSHSLSSLLFASHVPLVAVVIAPFCFNAVPPGVLAILSFFPSFSISSTASLFLPSFPPASLHPLSFGSTHAVSLYSRLILWISRCPRYSSQILAKLYVEKPA